MSIQTNKIADKVTNIHLFPVSCYAGYLCAVSQDVKV